MIMIMTKYTVLLVLATASLAGCSDSVWRRAPNVIGSGRVEQIKKLTHSSTGTSWAEYDVKLTDSDPDQLLYVRVSGSMISDSDISPSMGKRVAIKCYRENPGGACYASSYSYEGREL